MTEPVRLGFGAAIDGDRVVFRSLGRTATAERSAVIDIWQQPAPIGQAPGVIVVTWSEGGRARSGTIRPGDPKAAERALGALRGWAGDFTRFGDPPSFALSGPVSGKAPIGPAGQAVLYACAPVIAIGAYFAVKWVHPLIGLLVYLVGGAAALGYVLAKRSGAVCVVLEPDRLVVRHRKGPDWSAPRSAVTRVEVTQPKKFDRLTRGVEIDLAPGRHDLPFDRLRLGPGNMFHDPDQTAERIKSWLGEGDPGGDG